MKICISGPQCSGKSTLMKALGNIEMFVDHHFIDEPVRKLVAEKGIKINKIADYESQMMILEEHHRNTYRHYSLITDRGALDAFTYATWSYLKGDYSYKEWADFSDIFQKTMRRYDRIFILPPLEMKNDGFRSLDINWQNEIANLMEDIANEWCSSNNWIVPVYNVPTGNTNDYVKFILSLV